MSEREEILVELHLLIDEQPEVLQAKMRISRDDPVSYADRIKQIGVLLERLRNNGLRR